MESIKESQEGVQTQEAVSGLQLDNSKEDGKRQKGYNQGTEGEIQTFRERREHSETPSEPSEVVSMGFEPSQRGQVGQVDP